MRVFTLSPWIAKKQGIFITGMPSPCTYVLYMKECLVTVHSYRKIGKSNWTTLTKFLQYKYTFFNYVFEGMQFFLFLCLENS
jgi:hypothetical protein